MTIKKITFIVVLFSYSALFSQNFWQPITKTQISSKAVIDKQNQPEDFNAYQLDYEGLKNYIINQTDTSFMLSFPLENHKTSNFTVTQSHVLHPDLEAKYPSIRSYKGQDKFGNTISFTITVFGLHAQLTSTNQGSYIDPYTIDQQTYMLYNRNSATDKKPFTCSLKEEKNQTKPSSEKRTVAQIPSLRTYRLALSNTIEYADYHIKRINKQNATLQEKTAVVLAAKAVTINRVNTIYERDLAIRLQLIPENDQITFIDSDNFNNNDGDILIDQNQFVIDNTAGYNSYDVGHVVSTGGGGSAYLGSVCTNNKARGVTGLPSPVGDRYDVDFVAHELGHQFGANHTFNNSCSGNISNGYSYEPGSGSTIMGYAGVCPTVVSNEKTNYNVQKFSDDYFHAISLQQILNYTQSVESCGTETVIQNTAPVIDSIKEYVIPHSTPFKLIANATDSGANLTYCWEQFDLGQDFGKPSSTNTTKTLFRSQKPTEEPYRYFPTYTDVLTKTKTDWEVLPTVARNMNFIVTVRDNNPEAGLVAQVQTKVTTTKQGPFAITSQNKTNIRWVFGQNQIINWDVAGTDANGINTNTVSIKLSTNNGESFDVLLAENVPNDGVEAIKVPETSCESCRLLIEPTDNVYYAVNDEPFVIVSEPSDSEAFVLYPNPAKQVVLLQYLSSTENDLEVSISNALGQSMQKVTFPYSKLINQVIDVSELQNGIYFVQVKQANRKITRKLVVTN